MCILTLYSFKVCRPNIGSAAKVYHFTFLYLSLNEKAASVAKRGLSRLDITKPTTATNERSGNAPSTLTISPSAIARRQLCRDRGC